jgi:arylsulfatase A-like enzyme
MRMHGVGVRLSAILLSGLAVGSLGLLEPLIRFWNEFHLLGTSWFVLVLLYLGAGLIVSISAGIFVSFGLATRAAERRPVVISSYYVSGTIAFAGVLVAAPFVRHELEALLLPVSYAVIYPILLLLGLLATTKLTPHVVRPLLSSMIGYPSGRISQTRLLVVMVLIGLLIPLTLQKSLRATYSDLGRPGRSEMRTRPSEEGPQNVLLITIDALRVDHLSFMGYDRPTSPMLDSLAAESVVFENCFAQSNRSQASLGALITSLYPGSNALRNLINPPRRLPEETETLAESMRDAGLTTAGINNNKYMPKESGLWQGLDRYDACRCAYFDLLPSRYLVKTGVWAPPEKKHNSAAVNATVVVDMATGFMEHNREKPFFLHLNFMDINYPYLPPNEMQSIFRTPGASTTNAPEFWRRCSPVLNAMTPEDNAFARADLLRMIDLYDGAIRHLDTEIGRLLEELDRLALTRKTVVILTSNFGEEFLDHGDVFHKSEWLYDELIHVPLMVRIPDLIAPDRKTELVRHIDLLPTLQTLFDLPVSHRISGTSLLPLLSGEGEWEPLAAFSQSTEIISLRTADRKLLYDLPQGHAYCFDLERDPREVRDIFGVDSTDTVCDSLKASVLEFLRLQSMP